MSYILVVKQDDEYARLDCDTLEQAQCLHRAFVNYGKCQEITIEHIEVDN